MEHDMEVFSGNTSNATNLSLAEYILQKLGPKHMDLTSSVLLSAVYCLVFVSGTVGNVCTCIVIAKNHYMQTTTNYYLFSLAVSDLMLLLFGLPPELYAIWESYPWRFGEAVCIVSNSVMEMTSYASVLTITAFTVERYVAICRPLQAHRMAGLSRCVKIIISIWSIALIAALPYSIHTRVFYELYHPQTDEPIAESLICNIRKEWRGQMTYMFQVSTFLFFVTPVTVIICLYILIGMALRKSALARGASDESHYGKGKNSQVPSQPRRVVIRMLVAVTVAFILCWAPFHAQRLMVLYVSTWTPQLMDVQSTLFYISGVLYFISSTVNPILYNVISRRYREAFKETICHCCYKPQTPTGNSVVYRWNSERNVKQPTVVLQRSFDKQHVTFQDEQSVKDHLLNGSMHDSLKVCLLDNSGNVKHDTCVDHNGHTDNCDRKLGRTCMNRVNGHMAPEQNVVRVTSRDNIYRKFIIDPKDTPEKGAVV